MIVAAATYEPFIDGIDRMDTYGEWLCERVAADAALAAHIARWRRMAEDGWDITALVAPDSKTVVAIGCR